MRLLPSSSRIGVQTVRLPTFLSSHDTLACRGARRTGEGSSKAALGLPRSETKDQLNRAWLSWCPRCLASTWDAVMVTRGLIVVSEGQRTKTYLRAAGYPRKSGENTRNRGHLTSPSRFSWLTLKNFNIFALCRLKARRCRRGLSAS